jgi:prepilin signal peptidase PulO-like enzyme (type II secretory pathway)
VDPATATVGRGMMALMQILSIPLLAVLAWIDRGEQRVPNVVVMPSLAAVLGLLLMSGDRWFVAEHLGCAFLLGLAFCLMAVQGGGMGDAKLVTLLGLVWGHLALWMAALAGMLATVVTVILALLGRKPISRGTTFPFVPYLFLSAVVIVLTELAR